jgi:anthranilate synthase component 1
MYPVTGRAQFRETARSAPAGARVPVEVRVTVADPFAAYRRARTGPGGVFVETTGGQAGWGYFATDPVQRVQVNPDAVGIDRDGPAPGAGGRDDVATAAARSPTLQTVDALLDAETLARGDCDVPFPCGWFGWLSYDVARELERLSETTDDDRRLPQLQAALYDCVAAWETDGPAEETDEDEDDGGETTLRITACPRVGTGGRDVDDEELHSAYDRALAEAMTLARRAVEGTGGDERPPIRAETVSFESDCGQAAFEERVRRVKEYVRDGDTFQANVSQRLSAPAAVHPVAAYAALRRVNPAPYSGLLEFPGVDLVSASPELLLRVDGRRLETEPIAGTRTRGTTPEEDAALERDLTTDDKERAEHAMLVDLERNDLGKVSEYGSVEVSEYRRVDRYAEVMHLVSRVEGRRRAGTSLVDAIAATFPGGTITGAPKPRTMEIIDEVEATRRGPYTGSIGLFGFDDRATLNIVIRTLVRTGDRYHLRVGAGIVHDSVPAAEWHETLAKGKALVDALDEALAETTLRVSTDGGERERASEDRP